LLLIFLLLEIQLGISSVRNECQLHFQVTWYKEDDVMVLPKG